MNYHPRGTTCAEQQTERQVLPVPQHKIDVFVRLKFRTYCKITWVPVLSLQYFASANKTANRPPPFHLVARSFPRRWWKSSFQSVVLGNDQAEQLGLKGSDYRDGILWDIRKESDPAAV